MPRFSGSSWAPNDTPLIYRQLRRVLVRRFPYAVYFGVDAADIVIFAVLHQRRAPKILDDRLDHPSG
jgi:plasmid stabilization system protein ParE